MRRGAGGAQDLHISPDAAHQRSGDASPESPPRSSSRPLPDGAPNPPGAPLLQRHAARPFGGQFIRASPAPLRRIVRHQRRCPATIGPDLRC